MATNLFILQRLTIKLFFSKIAIMSLFKNSWLYQSHLILCLLKVVRSLIKKLREKRKYMNVWMNSITKVEKILAFFLLLIWTVRLRKICSILHASTIIKKNPIKETVLSQEIMCHKIIIAFINFYLNNWYL